MATGEILINVVDGRRKAFDPARRLLVTARDGRQRNVFREFVNGNAIHLKNLEVRDNLDDRYTVLVSTKGHADAGFTPVTVTAGGPQVLDLMMLPRAAAFEFAPFEDIVAREDLHTFLCGDKPTEARALYDGLRSGNKSALACLLNITTALEQVRLAPAEGLDQNPLRSFKALRSAPEQDRIFAWADARLPGQILATLEATRDRDPAARERARTFTRFVTAPAFLHPGAKNSYKQTDFGEGNVQLSIHDGETAEVNGIKCVVIEADIDYFRDSGAHILLEVFPNKLKSRILGKQSAQSLTDPRSVYGLRWIAGQRLGREFTPPYLLTSGDPS
jgi:hypothetical protein